MGSQLLHILLAVCLFVGQSGVPVWAHYCKGEAQGMSLFAQAERCHSEAKEVVAGCCAHDHESHRPGDTKEEEDKDDCCTDEFSLFRLSQVESAPVEIVNFQPYWLSDRPAEVQKNMHHITVLHGREYVNAEYEEPPPLEGRLKRISLASFLC
ncbi:MAG: hypothetical protein AAF544_07175 [Bacteroidota bacterium]